MDFDKVLADLHEQLRNLDIAIESLERMQSSGENGRRSRPSHGSGPQKVSRKPVGDDAGGKKRA